MRGMTSNKHKVPGRYQFINQHLMFLMTLNMRQIYFRYQSPVIYTLDLIIPTNDVLEQRLAAVEGGVAAVATASGTSAIATTFMTLLKSGDHIVASNSLYGGTYNMLNNTLPRFGITTTFVDPDNVDNFKDALKPNTKVFLLSL